MPEYRHAGMIDRFQAY